MSTYRKETSYKVKIPRGRPRVGYKIVCEDWQGDLVSPWVARTVGGVTYGIGKRTVPADGNGPLCVFNNLCDAEKMIRSTANEAFHIYRCVYTRTEYNLLWRRSFFTASGVVTRLSKLDWCTGLELASSVTLTHEVESGDDIDDKDMRRLRWLRSVRSDGS